MELHSPFASIYQDVIIVSDEPVLVQTMTIYKWTTDGICKCDAQRKWWVKLTTQMPPNLRLFWLRSSTWKTHPSYVSALTITSTRVSVNFLKSPRKIGHIKSIRKQKDSGPFLKAVRSFWKVFFVFVSLHWQQQNQRGNRKGLRSLVLGRISSLGGVPPPPSLHYP